MRHHPDWPIFVDVFKKEQYDGEWPEENAIKFLAWFEEKINSIPKEFKDSAKVELEAVSSYGGCAYASIEIYYYRPETDEEEIARKAKEQNKAELQKQRELRQLEELKRKYGA